MEKLEITKSDYSFIQESLNETWYSAMIKLQGKNLGDIERNMIQQTQIKAKQLMLKIEYLNLN